MTLFDLPSSAFYINIQHFQQNTRYPLGIKLKNVQLRSDVLWSSYDTRHQFSTEHQYELRCYYGKPRISLSPTRNVNCTFGVVVVVFFWEGGGDGSCDVSL